MGCISGGLLEWHHYPLTGVALHRGIHLRDVIWILGAVTIEGVRSEGQEPHAENRL